MIDFGKLKSDYDYVKTDNFKAWAVSNLLKLSEEQKSKSLSPIEMKNIRKPDMWVKRAPLTEIISIMNRLGFGMFYGGTGAPGEKSQFMEKGNTKNAKGFRTKRRAIRAYQAANFDVQEIINEVNQTNFFVVAAREVAKMQLIYSQVLHGAWYVPNKDYRTFMKLVNHAAKNIYNPDGEYIRYENIKAVLKVFTNLMISRISAPFTDLELAMLFFIAQHDDKPVAISKVFAVFSKGYSIGVMKKAVDRLRREEYVDHYGKSDGGVRSKEAGRKAVYLLREKGWELIHKCIKEYLENVDFVKAEGILHETLN